MKEKIPDNREYSGVIITSENYREILDKGGRNDINFHNKHLRAYLKGKKIFTHGFRLDKEGNIEGPQIHLVKEKQ